MGVMAPPPHPVVLRVTWGGRHQGLEQRGTCEHSVHVLTARAHRRLREFLYGGHGPPCFTQTSPSVLRSPWGEQRRWPFPDLFPGTRAGNCSLPPLGCPAVGEGRAPGPGAFTHHWLPLLGGRWGLWRSGAPLPPAVCVEIAVQCVCGDRQDRCDQEPVEAGVGQAWASVCLSGGTKPSRAVGCLRKGVESAALASGDLLQSWQGLHFLDEEL